MRKIVTFRQKPTPRKANDNFECLFELSVIDSSRIGSPRERESIHTLEVTLTGELMERWRLDGASDFLFEGTFTEEMLKVAFQSAEDHITEMIKMGASLRKELPPLSMNTENSPRSCPYKLANILYPSKTSFTVDIDDRVTQTDTVGLHPNIQILMDRMDDALNRKDYAGVLHASASIFETLAKEVIGTPTVQNQTLKGFFERYRKDSTLPNEILDYVLAVYESRNITPLAGHGSLQTPNVTREEAVSLCEMTKAFVRIEYKLREKRI